MFQGHITQLLLLTGAACISAASAVADDSALFIDKEKYIGRDRPADRRPFTAAPAQLVLQNTAVKCEISSSSGNLKALTHLPKNLLLVERSEDVYVFNEKPISEKNDQVTGYRPGAQGNEKGFELRCVNPELPDLELTKQYALAEDRLVKTVYFRATSEKNNGQLIFLRSGLQMDESFFKGGYFYRPMWDGGSGPGSGTLVFTPGDDIKGPTKNKDMHGAFFCYVQPARGIGLAQYKFKVNGYQEGFLTIARQTDIVNDDTFFLPQGWDMYLTGDFIRKGDFLSCESHLMFFEGDAREFHRRYLAIPEFAERAKAKLPGWYKNVKAIGHCQYIAYVSDVKGRSERVKRMLSAFGPDEYFMYLLTDWCISGDYSVGGEIIGADNRGNWAFKTTSAEVRKNVQQFRSLAPDRLKLGMYSWFGSASDKSKIYQQHPDWLLKNEKNETIQYGSSEVYNYILNPVTWEQINLKIDQYPKLAQYMGLDYTYIDGGLGELINFFPVKNFVHGYHSKLFMKGVKDAAEKNGYAHFQNGSVFPDTSHGGYFECGMNQNLVDKRDWRLLGNAAYLCRYYHPDGQNASILYDASQGTSGRNVMYGLKPCLSNAGLWYYNNLCHALLTLDLSFEVKDNRIIVGDHVHPNWWNLETKTLESAFLKQGRTYLLPLVSHKEKTDKEKVTVKLTGLDIKPSLPIYLWNQQPLIDSGLDFTARTPESVETMASDLRVVSGADKLSLSTELKPNILKLVTFSQVPAFVYAVNGRRNNFYLSSSRGVEIAGEMDREGVRLSVQNEASVSAEIMALLPKGWKSAAVVVNGQAVEARDCEAGDYRFARFMIPKGESKILLNEKKGGGGGAEKLVSPRRFPYQDYALGFYPEDGDPKMTAADKAGVACWKITGAGTLVNVFYRGIQNTDGIAFKLHPGTAEGDFTVKIGAGDKAYTRKIALDFTGWKEFSFTREQFDSKPDMEWTQIPVYSFSVPAGIVYVSDFRFLPGAPDRKPAAPARKKQVVPFTATPPTLDGELNDECWRSAGVVTFAAQDGGDKATISLLYDKDNLYLAGKFEEPIVRLPSKVRRDDRSLCTAPNFEMYFIPKGVKKCFQLVTNPSGSQWDAVYDDLVLPIDNGDWNGKWKAASAYGFNLCWSIEVAIPFSDFGLTTPQQGDVWLTGLFRQGGAAGLSGWMYGGGNFFNIDKSFGELIFGEEKK